MTEKRPRTVLEAIIARFRESFDDAFRLNEPLSRYTTVGLGGPADFLLTVRSAAELTEAVTLAARQNIPYWVLGDGSNVLVADSGVRGLVIRNRAVSVTFRHNGLGVILRAESGANLSSLARRCASRGLAGLGWAAGIPGSVGGAVVGNAGAHNGDVASSLRSATVLDRDLQTRNYLASELGFGYRSSVLKRAHTGQGESDRVVLTADFELRPTSVEELEAQIAQFMEHRKQTQPAGASMGCMFKNPPDDYAGRLIDQAGMKEASVGGARISPVHANFVINEGAATAEDVRQLMARAWHAVRENFGIELEPEIELIGDWD